MHVEKRSARRFALRMVALVTPCNGLRQESSILITRDISSKGVFLFAEQVFQLGTPLRMEFFLIVPAAKAGIQVCSRIVAQGKVCRTSEEGMAVCFDGRCRLARVQMVESLFSPMTPSGSKAF